MTSYVRTMLVFVSITAGCFVPTALPQTETATISGRVTDESGAVVVGAEILLQSIDRGTVEQAKSNDAGIYLFPAVPAGLYHLTIRKGAFKTIDFVGLVVNVQDHIEKNVRMQVGSVAESVTVNAEDLHINTTDAAVSTVVDRNLAENLPLNGRSFQTLVDLTPGVVLTQNAGGNDSGQFSVNGQRASANYWMVDGVSANVSADAGGFGGNGLTGAAGITSVLGGTNSLVSVDALQEFRIQTSTFAPEYGRTPGGQISILTRSGTNQFHGSAFDYLRNDAFDAGDWFNCYTNNPCLPKAKERQNDFGGVLGGPIIKDQIFFFFSYEGLRLRLPQTALTEVPDLSSRNSAIPAMQPFLNAFPLPNGPAAVDSSGNLIPGAAQFNSSFSNPATLNATSLRLDYRPNQRLSLFGRYNYSPSNLAQRGAFTSVLSSVQTSSIKVQTATVGATWSISPQIIDEFRINYSVSSGNGTGALDNFGGATPLTTVPFPGPYNLQNGIFNLVIESLNVAGGSYFIGPLGRSQMRQWNLVDNISLQSGSHNIKLGIDYRHLSPVYDHTRYQQDTYFNDVPSTAAGTPLESFVNSGVGATFLFNNLSFFGQDTWRATPKLTLTYGLRWDTDFSPSSTSGPNLPAIAGFNLNDLSQLALAPAGTPLFHTTYLNFAPRIGVAYQLSQRPRWAIVARGGFGVFYDLATSEAANLVLQSGYPFSSPFIPLLGGTFPLSPAAAAAPPILPPTAANPGDLAAFDPNLKLPYTLQWNVALEQALGASQVFSATYLGSLGRRLLQTALIIQPNPAFDQARLTTNSATSDYDGLQLQFRRRVSKGLQALASYTWAHSIDTASAGSLGNSANSPTSGVGQIDSRGPSDFDVRNSFSAGVTYAIPSPKFHRFANILGRGWSLDTVVQAHSALPVTVFNGNFNNLTNGFAADIRPDVITGIPLYLYGPQYPGGKALNNAPGLVTCPDGTPSIGPFCNPPVDANGFPTGQGNLGRNALRGFGATQVDMSAHRDFTIHESWSLQFRVEAFNILNHPNFGPPVGDLSSPQFGVSTQMLGQALAGGNVGQGAFDPLYQVGGPRSLQLSLKLTF